MNKQPFPIEEDLAAKSPRLVELNAIQDMDHTENAIVNEERIENEAIIPEQNLERRAIPRTPAIAGKNLRQLVLSWEFNGVLSRPVERGEDISLNYFRFPSRTP